METSIATVCLSRGLVEKLEACAEAGFDAVEIMDADLLAAFESPEEIRALCARLGLRIAMFQPFRDAEGTSEEIFRDTLRRARGTFEIMQRLGTDLLLVCSNVGTATDGDEALAVDQLRRLADLAAEYGIRLAYEALAWGTYVSDYRDAWRIVQTADRPNLGVCLDSFHILSRGHDPAQIEDIPAEKIFFLQLADAPKLDMDVLSWSRHHRLFPGEGEFDLAGFLAHVVKAGYTGPLSLEVFNDTFRQTGVRSSAAHAHRSLLWLADAAAAAVPASRGGLVPTLQRLPVLQEPRGIDFVEIGGGDLYVFDQLFSQLGFTFRGRHHTKPVRLWSAGDARIILNEQGRDDVPRLRAVGLTVDDGAAAFARARALDATAVYRRTYAGEVQLLAVESPGGTEVYWNDHDPEESWVTEFRGGEDPRGLSGTIDHVNLSYAWKDFHQAVLFMSSVVGLQMESARDVPGPRGLVRSQVMTSANGVVRLPINLAPPTAPLPDRHVAIRVSDIVDVARRARARGLRFLRVPDNYYDDIAVRYEMSDRLLAELRELDLLYDRDAAGAFIHFYTATAGGVFVELVERIGGYKGYGGSNAPVRLASQRALASR